MKYVPVEVKENFNISKKHPLKEALVLTTSLCGVIVLLYLAAGLLAGILARYVPSSVEENLGKLLSSNIPYKQNTRKSAELQKLLDKLIVESGVKTSFPLQVQVMESKTVNALALPGGTIMFFTGLLELTESEEEIAFILAHEAGHFHNRDHMKSLGRSLIMYTVMSILNIGHGDISFSGITDLLELERSRSQEEDADDFAVQLIRNYYGNINGAVSFLQKMADKEKSPLIAKYFMTHPHPEERLNRILQQQ